MKFDIDSINFDSVIESLKAGGVRILKKDDSNSNSDYVEIFDKQNNIKPLFDLFNYAPCYSEFTVEITGKYSTINSKDAYNSSDSGENKKEYLIEKNIEKNIVCDNPENIDTAA